MTVKEPTEYQKIDGHFDSSDWRNSLIERTAKAELPDWVKECAIGYDNCQRRYFEVMNVGDVWIDIEYLDNGIGATCNHTDMQNCYEATKRPFNADEMKTLVGKVLDWEGNLELVISYDVDTADVYVDHMWCSAKYLMDNEYTIDGKLCYVLEHLNEKREWVK